MTSSRHSERATNALNLSKKYWLEMNYNEASIAGTNWINLLDEKFMMNNLDVLFLIKLMNYSLNKNDLEKAHRYLEVIGFDKKSEIVCLAHAVYMFGVSPSHAEEILPLLEIAEKNRDDNVRLVALLYKATIHDRLAKKFESMNRMSDSYPLINSKMEYHLKNAKLDFNSIKTIAIAQKIKEIEDYASNKLKEEDKEKVENTRLITLSTNLPSGLRDEKQIFDFISGQSNILYFNKNTYIPPYLQEDLLRVFLNLNIKNFNLSNANEAMSSIKDELFNLISKCYDPIFRQRILWNAIIPSDSFLSNVMYYQRGFNKPSIKSGKLYELVGLLKDEMIKMDDGIFIDVSVKYISSNMDFINLLNQVSPYIYNVYMSKYVNNNDNINLKSKYEHLVKYENNFLDSFSDKEKLTNFAKNNTLNNPDYLARVGQENCFPSFPNDILEYFPENFSNHPGCQDVFANELFIRESYSFRPLSVFDALFLGYGGSTSASKEVYTQMKRAVLLNPTSALVAARFAKTCYYYSISEEKEGVSDRVRLLTEAKKYFRIAMQLSSDNQSLHQEIEKNFDAMHIALARSKFLSQENQKEWIDKYSLNSYINDSVRWDNLRLCLTHVDGKLTEEGQIAANYLSICLSNLKTLHDKIDTFAVLSLNNEKHYLDKAMNSFPNNFAKKYIEVLNLKSKDNNEAFAKQKLYAIDKEANLETIINRYYLYILLHFVKIVHFVHEGRYEEAKKISEEMSEAGLLDKNFDFIKKMFFKDYGVSKKYDVTIIIAMYFIGYDHSQKVSAFLFGNDYSRFNDISPEKLDLLFKAISCIKTLVVSKKPDTPKVEKENKIKVIELIKRIKSNSIKVGVLIRSLVNTGNIPILGEFFNAPSNYLPPSMMREGSSLNMIAKMLKEALDKMHKNHFDDDVIDSLKNNNKLREDLRKYDEKLFCLLLVKADLPLPPDIIAKSVTKNEYSLSDIEASWITKPHEAIQLFEEHFFKYDFSQLDYKIGLIVIEMMTYRLNQGDIDKAYQYFQGFGLHNDSPIRSLAQAIYLFYMHRSSSNVKEVINLLDLAITSSDARPMAYLYMGYLMELTKDTDKNLFYYTELKKWLSAESNNIVKMNGFRGMNVKAIESANSLLHNKKTPTAQEIIILLSVANHLTVLPLPLHIALLTKYSHFLIKNVTSKMFDDVKKTKDDIKNMIEICDLEYKQRLLWGVITPSDSFLSKIFYLKRGATDPSIESGYLKKMTDMLANEIEQYGVLWMSDECLENIKSNDKFLNLLNKIPAFNKLKFNDAKNAQDFIRNGIDGSNKEHKVTRHLDEIEKISNEISKNIKEKKDYYLTVSEITLAEWLTTLGSIIKKNPSPPIFHLYQTHIARILNNRLYTRETFSFDFRIKKRKSFDNENANFQDDMILLAQKSVYLNPLNLYAHFELAASYYDKFLIESLLEDERNDLRKKIIAELRVAILLAKDDNEREYFNTLLDSFYFDRAKSYFLLGYYSDQNYYYEKFHAECACLKTLTYLAFAAVCNSYLPSKGEEGLDEKIKSVKEYIKKLNASSKVDGNSLMSDDSSHRAILLRMLKMIEKALLIKKAALQGDINATNEIIRKLKFDSNKVKIEEILGEELEEIIKYHFKSASVLTVIFRYYLGLDATEACRKFLTDNESLKIPSCFVDDFFAVLVKCQPTVNEVPNFKHGEAGKNELLSAIKKISDPALKIEVLVTALSSASKGRILGYLFHTKKNLHEPSLIGTNIHPSDAHLIEIADELRRILNVLDHCEPSEKSLSPSIMALVSSDKQLQWELSDYDSKLHTNLRKAVGLPVISIGTVTTFNKSSDEKKSNTDEARESLYSPLSPRPGRTREDDLL